MMSPLMRSLSPRGRPGWLQVHLHGFTLAGIAAQGRPCRALPPGRTGRSVGFITWPPPGFKLLGLTCALSIRDGPWPYCKGVPGPFTASCTCSSRFFSRSMMSRASRRAAPCAEYLFASSSACLGLRSRLSFETSQKILILNSSFIFPSCQAQPLVRPDNPVLGRRRRLGWAASDA